MSIVDMIGFSLVQHSLEKRERRERAFLSRGPLACLPLFCQPGSSSGCWVGGSTALYLSSLAMPQLGGWFEAGHAEQAEGNDFDIHFFIFLSYYHDGL